MLDSYLLSFSIATFILAIAPGPDNLFVLSQSALYGAKSGLIVVMGLCTGLVIQTMVSMLGLGAIIVSSTFLFNAIKVLGALYLSYLAFMSFKYAKTSLKKAKALELSTKALYFRGFIMNITNPKVQLFFLAFFPQFLPQNLSYESTLMTILLFGIITVVATIVVFSSVALLAGRLNTFIEKPKVSFAFNICCGFLFVSLAVSALAF